jgi:hypothetical protein
MFEADSRVIGTASHVAEIEASDDEQEAEVYEGDSHTRRFGGLFSSHRKAKAAIASRIEAQIKRKVKEEAPDYSPKVFVGELAASSVDLTVRAWTSSGDYWGVFFSYNERFYNELPKHGINFPFPQIDVHMPTVK